MSRRLPTRTSTRLRSSSRVVISRNRPTTSTVSMPRVVRLRLTSARSYTCSMYTAGVNIMTFITPLNTARA